MVLSGLKIALLCYALSGCEDRAAAVATAVVFGPVFENLIDSANKPEPPPKTDELVCNLAASKGKWETRARYQEYVEEAKKRKLTCGVDEEATKPRRQQSFFPSLPF